MKKQEESKSLRVHASRLRPDGVCTTGARTFIFDGKSGQTIIDIISIIVAVNSDGINTMTVKRLAPKVNDKRPREPIEESYAVSSLFIEGWLMRSIVGTATAKRGAS